MHIFGCASVKTHVNGYMTTIYDIELSFPSKHITLSFFYIKTQNHLFHFLPYSNSLRAQQSTLYSQLLSISPPTFHFFYASLPAISLRQAIDCSFFFMDPISASGCTSNFCIF
ncbi:hypothetical protein NE237_022288 [Protea cynaroides]|uniref:Uncharacterized protein n=1 Tax=Protea cynaroides TaxID=273540 RepID=A0A9Q0HET2_9MAGN|nr:hypothetical protein NE237_022288 [Protea cynaroides]